MRRGGFARRGGGGGTWGVFWAPHNFAECWEYTWFCLGLGHAPYEARAGAGWHGRGVLLHVSKDLEKAYDLRRDAMIGTERRKLWAATVPLGGGLCPP